MKKYCKEFFLRSCCVLLLLHTCTIANAQKLIFTGVIKDKQSDEPIPFASVVFKVAGKGLLTDSLGKFYIELDQLITTDTLKRSSVGYKVLLLPIGLLKQTTLQEFKLEVQQTATEAIVKFKYNRALWFWRQIMKRKMYHDRRNYANFSYETYN